MRLVLALAVLLTAATPRPAPAQERMPRKWLFAASGAAFGVAATLIYSAGNYSTSLGWCSSPKCVGISTITFGTLVGFLIGREVDNHYAMRYRAAPPIDLVGRARSLRTRASGLELADGLLAAHGDDGVELIEATPALVYRDHRARGLRDVTDIALEPATDRLLVGTATGLYLYGLEGDAGGRRAWRGELAALALRGDRVALATGIALRLGLVSGDSVQWQADSSPTGDRVTDLRWSNDSLLWVLTESALFAYHVSADSAPALLGQVEMRGSLRRLALADTLAAVGAGSEGVYLVHVGDPTLPRETAHWAEPRYVYDVAFWQGMIAAGAGPEGLYLLEPSPQGDALRAIGLHRDAGFVAALAATASALFTLDRTAGAVRRFERPRFQDRPGPR